MKGILKRSFQVTEMENKVMTKTQGRMNVVDSLLSNILQTSINSKQEDRIK